MPLIQTFSSSSAEAYNVADLMESHWAQRGDRNAVTCHSNNALKRVLAVMGNRFFKAISLVRKVVGVDSHQIIHPFIGERPRSNSYVRARFPTKWPNRTGSIGQDAFPSRASTCDEKSSLLGPQSARVKDDVNPAGHRLVVLVFRVPGIGPIEGRVGGRFIVQDPHQFTGGVVDLQAEDPVQGQMNPDLDWRVIKVGPVKVAGHPHLAHRRRAGGRGAGIRDGW